ncbi:MAG: HAD family phosphatase [Bacteroidales bacterium]|nr:HAD family phosphatase [Clostridium sp.]MCM1203430.1 HAD family phosphatase [Bacteroidales bacterium]
MIEAVVFDMDGVIFDSEKLYRKHWMITGREYGIADEVMERLCNRIAGATKEHNEKLMKSHFGEAFDYDTFRTKTMMRMDKDISEHGIELKPGVMELFGYLTENGYKIGLATSTIRERAERNLKNAGILEFFDGIVYGGTVPHGKPAPDIYIKACEQLGVAADKAMGIEDSLNGVKASAAAGLYTVMVIDLIQPTGEIKPLAKQIYHSLAEVAELLQKGII